MYYPRIISALRNNNNGLDFRCGARISLKVDGADFAVNCLLLRKFVNAI